jgi:hypothetical protein
MSWGVISSTVAHARADDNQPFHQRPATLPHNAGYALCLRIHRPERKSRAIQMARIQAIRGVSPRPARRSSYGARSNRDPIPKIALMLRARFDIVPPPPRIAEPTCGRHGQRTMSRRALSAGHVGADQSEASARQRAERFGIVTLVVHLDRVRPGSDRERGREAAVRSDAIAHADTAPMVSARPPGLYPRSRGHHHSWPRPVIRRRRLLRTQ